VILRRFQSVYLENCYRGLRIIAFACVKGGGYRREAALLQFSVITVLIDKGLSICEEDSEVCGVAKNSARAKIEK